MIGMLVAAPSVAFPAYLVRLDSGATVAADRYWHPRGGDLALECGGVTLILPQSRIRGVEPLTPPAALPTLPAPQAAPAPVSRAAVEQRLQSTAYRLLHLQMAALEAGATGTPQQVARIERKLTRTRALRAALDRQLAAPPAK